MKIFFYWAALWLLFTGNHMAAQSVSDSATGTIPQPDFRAYQVLHLPDLRSKKLNRVIKVAIVDDGWRLTHRAIKDYILKNEKEIPGNGLDDDANGYTDDVSGYDVADNDPDVSVPAGRESFFYHGTMTAGIISRVAEQCLGEKARRYLRIIPIKVMSDKSQKPYYELGYEGIAYALKQNPDIIVCPWSGGTFDAQKYSQLFTEAQRKGVLIIASAGNFYSEKCDPPASIGSVYAVAALDTLLHKTERSNYGEKIDLSAAGEFVYAPYCIQDNTYSYHDGTSAASSLVAGCAVVLKLIAPSSSPVEVMDALKNTAWPLDSLNRFYAGKLGAGLPNLGEAVNFIETKKGRSTFFNSKRPEGEIIVDKSSSGKWLIAPEGGYKGIVFSLKGNWNKVAGAQLLFYSNDSLINTQSINTFPTNLNLPAYPVLVEYQGKRTGSPLYLSYASVPIDSTTLYCSHTKELTGENGETSDGSGQALYAGNSNCKWQITVPDGKRVKIIFDEFDTQAKTDFVWLFEGTATLQENLLAKFSGSELPPVIVSGSNKILVWFVTDKTVNGRGWHLNYTATDEQPGVLPPPQH